MMKVLKADLQKIRPQKRGFLPCTEVLQGHPWQSVIKQNNTLISSKTNVFTPNAIITLGPCCKPQPILKFIRIY